MKTLDELIKENSHENEKNMILKYDIEGSEWNILYKLKNETLKQFKYIVIELCNFNRVSSKGKLGAFNIFKIQHFKNTVILTVHLS